MFYIVSVPLRGKDRERPTMGMGAVRTANESFPSPCGEKIGKDTEDNPTGEALVLDVSVPLRGKDRERPLRVAPVEIVVQEKGKFPSPCGEKIGKDVSGTRA